MEPRPTSQKKILYVITKANFGGAQRYVYDLAEYSHGLGYKVAVAAGGTGELIDRLQARGIPTYTVSGLARDIGFFKELQALVSLYRIFRSYQPDIVHLNSGKAGVLGALAAYLARVPKRIFTAHGWSFLEPRGRVWKTVAFLGSYLTALLATDVIVVSRNDLRGTRMPGVRSKTHVIHTACTDFPRLSRDAARAALFDEATRAVHAEDMWVVTTAELNHNKNHTTALDAVAEFNSTHSSKIFYTIVGSGELQSALEEQIALRGLHEYVHFTGQLPEARSYLEAFDVFLLPSKKEGLPYALLEAGMAGLPCIASAVGGIPEVITDRVTGLLTTPKNHMSIMTAFEHLLQYPDDRIHMSTALKKHVNTDFDLTKMQAATISLYER